MDRIRHRTLRDYVERFDGFRTAGEGARRQRLLTTAWLVDVIYTAVGEQAAVTVAEARAVVVDARRAAGKTSTLYLAILRQSARPFTASRRRVVQPGEVIAGFASSVE